MRRSVGTRPRSETTRTRSQRKENAIRVDSRLFAVGYLMCPHFTRTRNRSISHKYVSLSRSKSQHRVTPIRREDPCNYIRIDVAQFYLQSNLGRSMLGVEFRSRFFHESKAGHPSSRIGWPVISGQWSVITCEMPKGDVRGNSNLSPVSAFHFLTHN